MKQERRAEAAEARNAELEKQANGYAHQTALAITQRDDALARLRAVTEAADAMRDAANDAHCETVDATPYPDGPNMDGATRAAISEAILRYDAARSGVKAWQESERPVHNPENVPAEKLPKGHEFPSEGDYIPGELLPIGTLMWIGKLWANPKGRVSMNPNWTYAVPITPEKEVRG